MAFCKKLKLLTLLNVKSGNNKSSISTPAWKPALGSISKSLKSKQRDIIDIIKVLFKTGLEAFRKILKRLLQKNNHASNNHRLGNRKYSNLYINTGLEAGAR